MINNKRHISLQEKGTEIKHKFTVLDGICYTVLVLVTLFFFYKIIWALYTSLKTRTDYMISAVSILPNSLKFSNYVDAFKNFYITISSVNGVRKVYIEEMILNTFSYALIGVMVKMVVTVVCAYTVARFNHFIASKIIIGVVLVIMILPIYGTDSSNILVLKQLGFYDSLFTPIFCNFNFLGFNFILFYNLFRGVGAEYIEAAKIDGASEMRILGQVAFPFVSAIFWLYTLQGFIANWSDFSWQLIYMPSHPSISYGLFRVANSSKAAITDVPTKIAACLIVFLPIFILFIIFRKKFLTNDINFSGVKG